VDAERDRPAAGDVLRIETLHVGGTIRAVQPQVGGRDAPAQRYLQGAACILSSHSQLLNGLAGSDP